MRKGELSSLAPVPVTRVLRKLGHDIRDALMSKIYRLRQGLLGQEVNAVESPIRQLRWLKQGTQFFIHHEKHTWNHGCSGQYYCTILVEDSCKCYNVTWPALQMLMEELEPAAQ